MGMFDYFEPEPELACPRCGRVLSGWQGKDGEDALFVWRQGVRHPVDQRVPEESRLDDAQLARFTLPEEFSIVTHCSCSTAFLIEAIGTAVDGLWRETRLVRPDEIEERYALLPRPQRKAMRRWLSEKV